MDKTLKLSWLVIASCLLLGSQIGVNSAILSSPPAGGGGGGPSTITGLQFWFAADCTTFTSSVCSSPSNGATISTWADESGNGHTATQLAGSCVYHTAQQNGQPAVTFASGCNYSIATGPVQAATTEFAVVKLSSTAAISVITGAGNNGLVYLTCSGGKYQGAAIEFVTGISTGTASCDTSWHQINLQNTTGTMIFRIDRTADTRIGSTISGGVTGTNQLGNDTNNSGAFTGQLAEVFAFDHILSGSDLTAMETYIFNKYAL